MMEFGWWLMGVEYWLVDDGWMVGGLVIERAKV